MCVCAYVSKSITDYSRRIPYIYQRGLRYVRVLVYILIILLGVPILCEIDENNIMVVYVLVLVCVLCVCACLKSIFYC